VSRSSPFQGRKRLGDSGEEIAARFLEKRGYRVLERNYRSPVGELDIIALHRGTVVFVEVKARTSGSYGAPSWPSTRPNS
jgi:putative endonuclease